MGKHFCNDFDRQVLQIISEQPGATGFQIHQRLSVRWKNNHPRLRFLEALLGPSIGKVYLSLAHLERFELVDSWWGVATESRGGNRARHYRCKS